jgi:hypothetical protein
MTYARARLWLGIGGVGVMVVLSAAGLLTGLPQRLLGELPATAEGDLRGLGLILAVYVAVSLPLDALGGFVLPRRFGRPTPTPAAFVGGWLRGVAVQSAWMLLCGLAVLSAGRAGGAWAAVAALGGLMAVMLLSQEAFARLVGGIGPAARPADLSEPERVLRSWGLSMPPVGVVAAGDPAFVGGTPGLPGFERVVLPEAWLKSLPAESVAAQLARRVGVLERGSRARGVIVAVAWNLAGFALSLLIPGAGVTTVAGLLTAALGFTVWSFVGLLVLPSVSRPGVFEADAFALRRGVRRDLLERTASEIDKLQDDEPARPPLVEMIFHPIPSVGSRAARLADGAATGAAEPLGAWQAARVALFLSWACLGFLSRAVHCNSGRPELWVMLPGD